jgi:hypothetical protein
MVGAKSPVIVTVSPPAVEPVLGLMVETDNALVWLECSKEIAENSPTPPPLKQQP